VRLRRPIVTLPRIAATAVLATGCAALASQAGALPSPDNGDDRSKHGLVTSKAQSEARPAEPRPAGLAPKADFNKDGYQDQAVSAPNGSVGSKKKAGYVAVVYGSAKGADTGHRQILHMDSPGVAGEATEYDEFGNNAVARDLNGDGFTDLAVGAYNRNEPERRFVTVLWGSADGLASGTRLSAVKWLDGEQMAGGDFNGDGKDDLAATTNEKNGISVLSGPFKKDGTPADIGQPNHEGQTSEIYGLAAGDMTGDGKDDLVGMQVYEETAEGSLFWKGSARGLADKPKKLESGATGTIGDIDKDGYGDLVMRIIPDDAYDLLEEDEGTVKVFYGSPDGPGRKTTTVNQDSPAMPGVGEKGDQFGYDLTAGDVNGDGYADIGVGVPYETIASGSSRQKTGTAMLLPGGKRGTFGTRTQLFSQDSHGVPGRAEAKDLFGRTVSLRDLNDDGLDELTLGAPGEDIGVADAGAAWVLRGTPGGLGSEGVVSFTPSDLGAPADGAQLGRRLAK
jgi:FG-GAP repeat protein/VCBS repeat protein